MKVALKQVVLLYIVIMHILVLGYTASAAAENVAPMATVSASVESDDGVGTPKAVNDGKWPETGTGATKWYVQKNVSEAWLQMDFETDVRIASARVISGWLSGGKMADITTDFKFQYRTETGKWADIDGSTVTDNTMADKSVKFTGAVTARSIRFIPLCKTYIRVREIELYTEDYEAMAENEAAGYFFPSDIVGGKYEDSVKMLYALSITNTNLLSFDPDGIMTRSSFAEWISEIFGLSADGNTKYFTDIEPNSSASNKINALVETGILHGYIDATFRGEDEITYNEAIKMLVSILGYGQKAQALGGYPNGYASIAKSLDLNKNITMRKDGILNRGECAILICNMLEAPVCREGITAGDTISFEEGGSLLEEYFGIKKSSGIVYANYTGGLNNEAVASKDSVNVGGVIYKSGRSGIAAAFGRMVEFYYTDKDAETILYYRDGKKVSSLIIDARDIKSNDGFSTIRYNKNGKEKSADIAPEALFAVNGSEENVTAESLKPIMGYIELIDNNGDSKYDVVLVHSQEIYVIKGIDIEKEILYTDSGQINLHDYQYRILSGGKDIEPEYICEGEAVVIERDSKNFLRCMIGGRSEEGIISNINEDDGYLYITINDVEYLAAEQIKEFTEIGTQAKVILTYNDTAAAINIDWTQGPQYGVITGIDDNIENITVSIFTSSGERKVYIIAEKFYVNDEKAEPADLMSIFFANMEDHMMLVRYCLNSAGELNKLYYSQLLSSEPKLLGKNEDKVLKRYSNVSNGYYISNGTLVDIDRDRNIIVNDDTLIFYVIKENSAYITDNIKVGVGPKTMTQHKCNGVVNVYNLREGYIAEALFYKRDISTQVIAGTANVSVVKKVSVVYDEQESETCCKLTVYENGNEKEYLTGPLTEYDSSSDYGTFENGIHNYSNVLISELSPGDVLQLNTYDDRIHKYRILMRRQDSDIHGKLQFAGGTDDGKKYYPYLETICGYIEAKGDDYFIIRAGETQYNYKYTTPNVYVYEDGKLRQGSENDLLQTGAVAFVHLNQRVLKNVVIYR